jgi:hypothetical protein
MRHFLTAAAVGLVLSVAAHIATYCATSLTRLPGVVLSLRLGMFPVILAAAVAGSRLPGKAAEGAAGCRAGDEGALPEGTPRWLRRWMVALTAYLFALWLVSSAVPAVPDGGVPIWKAAGRLVLRGGGRIIRSAAAVQIEARVNRVLRWHSGGCMYFYSLSLIPLLAWRRSRKQPGGVESDPELA